MLSTISGMMRGLINVLIFLECVTGNLIDVGSGTGSVEDDGGWLVGNGKQYKVFPNPATSFKVDKAVCAEHGAILPEPRTETENTFLSGLTSRVFYLGMTDQVTEGTWRWDSDGSVVTWYKWMQWESIRPEPNGRRQENCAIIPGSWLSDHAGSRPGGWGDLSCVASLATDSNVVCQRDYTETPLTPVCKADLCDDNKTRLHCPDNHFIHIQSISCLPGSASCPDDHRARLYSSCEARQSCDVTMKDNCRVGSPEVVDYLCVPGQLSSRTCKVKGETLDHEFGVIHKVANSSRLKCRWYLDPSGSQLKVTVTLVKVNVAPGSPCNQVHVRYFDCPQSIAKEVDMCNSTQSPITLTSCGAVQVISTNPRSADEVNDFIVTYKRLRSDQSDLPKLGACPSPVSPTATGNPVSSLRTQSTAAELSDPTTISNSFLSSTVPTFGASKPLSPTPTTNRPARHTPTELTTTPSKHTPSTLFISTLTATTISPTKSSSVNIMSSSIADIPSHKRHPPYYDTVTTQPIRLDYSQADDVTTSNTVAPISDVKTALVSKGRASEQTADTDMDDGLGGMSRQLKSAVCQTTERI